jgi:hypothetical protein
MNLRGRATSHLVPCPAGLGFGHDDQAGGWRADSIFPVFGGEVTRVTKIRHRPCGRPIPASAEAFRTCSAIGPPKMQSEGQDADRNIPASSLDRA